MFSEKQKLTKGQSASLLLVLEAFASSGYGILDSLKLKLKSEKSERVRGILDSCISAIESSEPIPDALARFGVITSEEKDLLSIKNPEGAASSLNKIVEMRDSFKSRFEKIFMFSLIPTILSTFFVLLALYINAPMLLEYFEKMIRYTVVNPDDKEKIRSMIWYLYQRETILILDIVIGVTAVGGWLLYTHFYNTNRRLIYKIL